GCAEQIFVEQQRVQTGSRASSERAELDHLGRRTVHHKPLRHQNERLGRVDGREAAEQSAKHHDRLVGSLLRVVRNLERLGLYGLTARFKGGGRPFTTTFTRDDGLGGCSVAVRKCDSLGQRDAVLPDAQTAALL